MRYLTYCVIAVCLLSNPCLAQEADELLKPDATTLNKGEFDASIDLIAYPNPTQGQVSIMSVTIMDESEVQIKLYNEEGRLMKEFANFGKKVQPLDLSLDLSDFPNGTYFYYIYSSDALVTYGQIIKE